MAELPRCKHCGDEIWRDDTMGPGWFSDADDVCGTEMYRDHEPRAAHEDCREHPCPYCKALIEADTGDEPDRDEAGTDPAHRMEDR